MLRWLCAGRATSSRARCKNQLFAALDWLPTLVDIAGGPKGDELKKQIEAGKYPASSRPRSTALTSVTISKASRKSRRAMYFFYYLRRDAVGGALQELEDVLHHVAAGATGWIMPLIPFHFTLVQNIKRDPFEQNVGIDQKSAMAPGRRARRAGHRLSLRLEHAADRPAIVGEALMSYKKFPPLQSGGDLQPHAGHRGGSKGSRQPPARRLTAYASMTRGQAPSKGACFRELPQLTPYSTSVRTFCPRGRPPMPSNLLLMLRSAVGRCSRHWRRFRLSFSAAGFPLSALAQTSDARRRAAVMERRSGEASDPRLRARHNRSSKRRFRRRQKTASPRSIRTARSGSSSRCTRRWSIAWSASRRW